MITLIPKRAADSALGGKMKGRWRFRIVHRDYSAQYAVRDGAPLELQGTDDESLRHSRLLASEYPEALRVEVVSVGCPSEITDCPGRAMVCVQERHDKQGWNLLGELMSGTWHRKLVDAVSYAAFRTRGSIAELRIVNSTGAITHVVLIDATDPY